MRCGPSSVSKSSIMIAVKLIGYLEHSHQNQNLHGLANDFQILRN